MLAGQSSLPTAFIIFWLTMYGLGYCKLYASLFIFSFFLGHQLKILSLIKFKAISTSLANKSLTASIFNACFCIGFYEDTNSLVVLAFVWTALPEETAISQEVKTLLH